MAVTSCRNSARTALPSRRPEHARPSPLAIRGRARGALSHALFFISISRFLRLARAFLWVAAVGIMRVRRRHRPRKSGVGDIIPLVAFVSGPLLLANLRLFFFWWW